MPDGGKADVSIKPDDVKALAPSLDGIKAAIELMGKYLSDNRTDPGKFGRTPNAPQAGRFFVERRDALADVGVLGDFVDTFKNAILAAADGHEDNEQALSDKFKNIDGGM